MHGTLLHHRPGRDPDGFAASIVDIGMLALRFLYRLKPGFSGDQTEDECNREPEGHGKYNRLDARAKGGGGVGAERRRAGLDRTLQHDRPPIFRVSLGIL
jgi:hypothetical protein